MCANTRKCWNFHQESAKRNFHSCVKPIRQIWSPCWRLRPVWISWSLYSAAKTANYRCIYPEHILTSRPLSKHSCFLTFFTFFTFSKTRKIFQTDRQADVSMRQTQTTLIPHFFSQPCFSVFLSLHPSLLQTTVSSNLLSNSIEQSHSHVDIRDLVFSSPLPSFIFHSTQFFWERSATQVMT